MPHLVNNLIYSKVAVSPKIKTQGTTQETTQETKHSGNSIERIIR